MFLWPKEEGKHWTTGDVHHMPPPPFLQWPRSFSGPHTKSFTPLSTWWSLHRLRPTSYTALASLRTTMTVTVACWLCPLPQLLLSRTSPVSKSCLIRNSHCNIEAWKAVLVTCLPAGTKYPGKSCLREKGFIWLTAQVECRGSGN